MSSGIPTVSDQHSLMEAGRKMVQFGFPEIPVIDSRGSSLGIVTQGDLMRLLVTGTNLEDTAVGEVATGSISVAVDDGLDTASRLLSAASVQMLTVVEDGRFVGVLTHADIEAQRRLQTVLGDQTANLITEISPSDAMHSGSRGSYVIAGISALQCVRHAMRLADRFTFTRILDLPCGHGRVLRILKAAFPDAHLTASDLDRDGVDFCAGVFGAERSYSHSEPAEVTLSGGYDLIWCGSLFTHLDAPRWPPFLDLFGHALAPGGLLVFTTHGRQPAHALRMMAVSETDIQTMHEGYDRSGFGYAQMPIKLEEDYGLTIASPEWVRNQVGHQFNLSLINHAERAWQPPAPRQDVVTCIRPTN